MRFASANESPSRPFKDSPTPPDDEIFIMFASIAYSYSTFPMQTHIPKTAQSAI